LIDEIISSVIVNIWPGHRPSPPLFLLLPLCTLYLNTTHPFSTFPTTTTILLWIFHFNMVMVMKGKPKNNIKARIDITLFCHCKNMDLVYAGSRVAKPKESFVLDKNTQLLVYKWLKSLCFLDEHASNISRLVNLEDYRLYGIKSHDCRVFMQTLIPLTYHDLLPKGIWDVLTKISHFFRDI
jgi:hypothetical protein